ETHPELYAFALDPLGWIATEIGDVVDAVRWFLRDPSAFIHWQLLKMDSPLAPFWADPWHTVLTEIGEHAGLPSKWWEDVPGIILGRVVDSAEYIVAECVFRFW
ncbi:unnamed protein product, partial [marine sediment metagenome]